jgi:uncharacterized protein (DUF433 family)
VECLCSPGRESQFNNIIDYIKGVESIDDFLCGFPTVKREQVIAFIEAAKDKLFATGGAG